AAGIGKHMPGRRSHDLQAEVANDLVEERRQARLVFQPRRITATRLDQPLRTARHARLAPHSGQNFAARGICLPHSAQYTISALAPPWAPAPGVIASAICLPIAMPPPSPTPSPADPPGFAAAIGMDSAAFICA